MRVSAVAFTQRGVALARDLARLLTAQGHDVQVSAPARLAGEPDVRAYKNLSSWASRSFERSDALLFVSACGIAVRTVGPLARSKYADPAVVCVDDRGTYAIPLLSGHVGGANALAREVASLCGAQPVITTATDVNGVFAVDEWAARQGLSLVDRVEAKEVAASLLEGLPVGLVSTYPLAGEMPAGIIAGDAALTCDVGISISLDAEERPFATTVRLVPRVVTVGMGCKRGTSSENLATVLGECLAAAHVSPQAILAVATIDAKADEQGLHDLADALGVPLRLYSADELATVPGSFASSEFVRKTVGVDNVCERAACAQGEELLMGRMASQGVTVALGVVQPHLSFGVATGQGGRP